MMPKRLHHPTAAKPVLRRDHLAREAASLRKRATLALDSETRVEFEEMAERREVLALAVEMLEQAEPAAPGHAPGADARPEPPPNPDAAKD